MTMTQRVGTWVAVTVLSVTGGLVPVAGAQERPGASPAALQAAPPSGGMAEGIKVKGHWVIEVRNPDGALVRRQEFDNALQLMGRFTIRELLLRRATAGMWTVTVFDGLCPITVGTTVCILTENDANLSLENPALSSNVYRTLTTSSTFADVRLQGTFTAANTGTVASVATFLGRCQSVQPAATCTAGSTEDPFSATTLSSPVPVTSGQIVQLTVIFSFS